MLLLKDFALAKSRLAGVLAPQLRRELSQAMAVDVLGAVCASGCFSSVSVLVGCHEGQALCVTAGVEPIPEHSMPGIDVNARAHAWLHGGTVAQDEPVLFLHADLPLLRAVDVQALMRMHRPGEVTIATDRREKGSNAMVLQRGCIEGFAWGEDSLCKHRALVTAGSGSCRVAKIPRMALDIDVPRDLQLLRRHYQRSPEHGASAALFARRAFADERAASAAAPSPEAVRARRVSL